MFLCFGIIITIERQGTFNKKNDFHLVKISYQKKTYKGYIMANSIEKLLTELNVRLDEHFTLFDLQLSHLSILSSKSNLLIHFSYVQEKLNNPFVLNLYQYFQDEESQSHFNLLGTIEKSSSFSIDDVFYLLENF